eukprot:CCRYP_013732-RA/>CCRYP_013732-RA protein AED:0.40 eAED:0.40 QI:0/0/0/1/1/1/2/0/220
MLTTKLLLNSIISTPGARFMTIEFLPQHTHGASRVHAPETKQHARQHHRTLSTTVHRNSRWLCVCPHSESATQQYAHKANPSPPLNKTESLFVKEVIGVFLYNACAVDCTMLAALGSLAAQQPNPTQTTMKYVKQFLDYAASHPDARVTYQSIDMVLAVHSDAPFLSKTKAQSRTGGHFFLSTNEVFQPNNGAVLTISQIVKVVLSSAAKAELETLYINS